MPVRILLKSKAVTGDKPPEELVLAQDLINIGRGETCEVVLNDQVVSRNHVRISRDGALYFLEDLGSSFGTRVNGAGLPKGEKRLLRNGDVIAIGPYDLTFDRIAEADSEKDEKTNFVAKKVVKDALRGLSSGQGPYLRVMNGPLEGKRYELAEAQEIVLGRDETCDVILDDDLTSRRHANVRRDWDGSHIEDLNSRNGVKVNKRKITAPVTLKDRDELEIGGTRFLYLDPAEVRETPILPEQKPKQVPLAAEEEGTEVGKDPPPPVEEPVVSGESAVPEEEESAPEDEPEEKEEDEVPAPEEPVTDGAPRGKLGQLQDRLPKLPAGLDLRALLPVLIFGGIALSALIVLGILFFGI